MAVSFNYEQTISQAKLLDELASDLQSQTVRKLDNVYENITAAWTGDSAKAYLKYVQYNQEYMTRQVNLLKQSAEFLRKAAQRMRAAEQAAKQASQM